MQKKLHVSKELPARSKLRALSELHTLSELRAPKRRDSSYNNSSVHAAAHRKTAMVTVRS